MKHFSILFCILTLIGCSGDKGTASSSGIDFEGQVFDLNEEACNDHLKMGSMDSDQILCREGYAAGYNYSNKVSNWVSYYITKDSVSITRERIDSFSTDDEVPAIYQSTLEDYSGSGFDRGHLAPRATMDFTASSMKESFLLTNIAPQNPNFNRGIWAEIEQDVRDCAVKINELYIITGGVYDNNSITIGDSVRVPSYFYKVIFKPTSPASAFVVYLPNKSDASIDFISINDLENIIGEDVFSSIRDDIEVEIEKNKTPFCTIGSSPVETVVDQTTRPTTTVPPTSDVVVCGSKTTCGEMVSCSEARYYLSSCGLTRLDRDNDGVPCESICN